MSDNKLDTLFDRPKRPPLTPSQIEAYREALKDPDWYKEPLRLFRERLERRLNHALRRL